MLGCTNSAWVGDGYCDDVTNNMECNYDGGDCCLDPVNTQYCSECQCLDGSGTTVDPGTTDYTTGTTTITTGTTPGMLKKSTNKLLRAINTQERCGNSLAFGNHI